MKKKEYEQLPKKDSKSLHLILGIVIGAIIATAIILVVLFATDVIGGEGSKATTSSNTTETTALVEEDTTAKLSSESKPNASEGKYREFRLENILFIQENSIGEQIEKHKTITIQVPYIDEYNFLGLDINSLEIDINQSACLANDKVTICKLDFLEEGKHSFVLQIVYSGDTFSYGNVLAMGVDSSVVSYNGQERWVDCRYLGSDKIVTTERGIDDEIVYRCTGSGYEYKNETYYDNLGNVITEEEYKAEEEKSRNEANASLEKYQ